MNMELVPQERLVAETAGIFVRVSLADTTLLLLRLRRALECQFEMRPSSVGHPGLEDQYSAVDQQTPNWVVCEAEEILTWAETDRPCFEQDHRRLWPTPGQAKTWQGLIFPGARP